MNLLETSWLIPALPLLGAVTLLFFGGRFLKEPLAGMLATACMAGSFGWTAVLFFKMWSLDPEQRTVGKHLFDWMPAGGLKISASLLLDPLSITFLLFITGVATLIHVYAIGYMHGDPRFSRFFCYLNLFAFSMIILVLGGNFLVTFLGWEGVGTCSYLLISFWFERPSAATAGKKAFITNRVGDFGFMIAVFLIISHLGTLEYWGPGNALEGASTLTNGAATGIALMLFLACTGKSAQFPLHVWLPDAMEGPTPVSALIHAATMVTSGIFLIARAHPFFEASGQASHVVAWVGVGTALLAATIAMVKNDIKRVLAYSTLSQLGYMFMALGIHAYSTAIFHVVTHAFFKACLFLGAGSVIHGMHDEQDMRRMGNLRKYMPITYATFMVAWLAIAGVPPFSGFWSKDDILAKAWFQGTTEGKALWAIGLLTAMLTAFYMTRQVVMVFFGHERFDLPVIAGGSDDGPSGARAHGADGTSAGAEPQDDHGPTGSGHGRRKLPHESPWIMTVPLVLLAGLSLVGGVINLPFKDKGWGEALTHWLEPVFEGVTHPEEKGSTLVGLAAVTVVLCAVLVGAAFAVYRHMTTTRDPFVTKLGPAAAVLDSGYGVDAAYAALTVGAGGRAAEVLAGPVDQGSIDGAVNGIGELLRSGLGTGGSRLQSGYVRRYAVGILTGSVGLVVFAVIKAW